MNLINAPQTKNHRENILVIKLSALGDFIQALGAMQAIRNHHHDAHLTLMTTVPFRPIGEDSGYFDQIMLDIKPRWFAWRAWLHLKRVLNQGEFSRVYDLQNSDRTAIYLQLFHPKPEWVGSAPGASHRNCSPTRCQGNAFEGHRQTLALAGISSIEIDTMSWAIADISQWQVRAPYVLLVPGSSPSHLQKRWPASYYAALANSLIAQNIQPVLLGASSETTLLESIHQLAPKSLNLAGETDYSHIATLARNALAAIGNDTGPLHIISATTCPTLILFCSQKSHPNRHGPIGKSVYHLIAKDLSQLSVASVIEKFEKIIVGN